jgi:Flp pilus assembly protein TadD
MRVPRRVLLVGLALTSSVGLPCLHAQQPTPKPSEGSAQKIRNPLNDLLDDAQAALDTNDYAAAIVSLQKFIAEKPGVAFAHFQLAYAYTALKRTVEAQAEYEECISLDPKMAESYLNLGILLLEENPSQAVSPLRKAVELLPSQSRPRYLLGVAQQQSGDLAGAAEAFEGATRLDPKGLDSLIHLGEVYLKENRAANAESKFRAALDLDPKSKEALQGLAITLDAQKKPEALDAYRSYLATEPQDQAARIRLLHLMVEQGQYDAALAEIDKTGNGEESSLERLKLKADIQIAQKKYPEAVATLKQAITLSPNDEQLHGGLGRIYMETRDFPSAEHELKAALQLDRNNLVYWKDLSSTYYLAGNYQATLATLDIIAKAETPGAGPWFIRALCYDKLGQVQAALDAYWKFLALDENKNPDQVWQANQRIHVLENKPDKKK